VKDGQHWYRLDGTPCYEIEGANGKARSPTVRDAREGIKGKLAPRSIVPSVTTVSKGIGMPRQLANWLVRNALECAATNPPQPGETADDYVVRIAADAARTRGAAAELGTRVHDAIERWLHGRITPGADLMPLVEPAMVWLSANVVAVLAVERSFATPRYGGKLDLLCRLKDGDRLALIDLKTQGTSARYDHKPRIYDEWGIQLVAYAEAMDPLRRAVLGNLIVSTTEPGVTWHVWDDRARLLRMWTYALSYWEEMHNMTPVESEE